MKKVVVLLLVILISVSAISQTMSEEERFALEFAADDAAFALENPIGLESVNKQISVWKRKRDYKNNRLEDCNKTRTLLNTEKPKITDRRSLREWKIVSDNLKETRVVIKRLGSSKDSVKINN